VHVGAHCYRPPEHYPVGEDSSPIITAVFHNGRSLFLNLFTPEGRKAESTCLLRELNPDPLVDEAAALSMN
jgi:hypothetical protein